MDPNDLKVLTFPVQVRKSSSREEGSGWLKKVGRGNLFINRIFHPRGNLVMGVVLLELVLKPIYLIR